MELTSLILNWLGSVRRRKAKNTYTRYKKCLYRFENFLPDIEIGQVTPEHIENFLMSLPYCPNTINVYLAAIKSFWNHLGAMYDLPNVAKKVKMLKPNLPKQRILTYEEYRKILAICNNKERKLIIFLANTALRVGELFSLSEGSFKGDFIYVQGKGGKFRPVFLNEKAKEVSSPNSEFINLLKSLHHRNTLYYMCKCLSVKAKIPIFSGHSLRHYCLTSLIKNDISLKKVSVFAGHASTRCTEAVYTHLVPEQDTKGITCCLDD